MPTLASPREFEAKSLHPPYCILKMKRIVLAASIAAATSTSLGRTLCSEVEKGSCECENGNQIDEFRAKDATCFMGNDAEGAVRNNIHLYFLCNMVP